MKYKTVLEQSYYGMPYEEDTVVKYVLTENLEEAERVAKEYASEAEQWFKSRGLDFGYVYSGQRIDGFGTMYRIEGEGYIFEIGIRGETY